ncbi:MAG: flagellar assembly protein FliX [Rhodovarius sp.]|nr:hypothetical protein [Rhodovarius sp.]MCX7932429.1 hypothetical protein [Rhodovarius sp.]MDW8313725.1 flagellar assembly protein FliX [Rhodovarius sp.]
MAIGLDPERRLAALAFQKTARLGPTGGFSLPAAQGVAGRAPPAATAPVAALPPLAAAMPGARDLAARRRAAGLLAGLSALQIRLLGGAGDARALSRLPDLLEGEDGEDPELAELLQALALRARIEWLRREGPPAAADHAPGQEEF